MRRIIFMILVALQYATPRCVQASELVPNPISAAQIDQYAERLHLSRPQWNAAADMQLAYAREFEEQLGADIKELTAQAAKAPWRGATLKARLRMLERVEALDKQLFDRIQTILNDDQIAMLPRVRLMRERDRLLQGPVAVYVWPPPDLSLLVDALELGDADAAVVEARVIAYEPAFNARLRELVAKQDRAFRDLAKQYEAAGIPESRLADEAVAPTLARLNKEFSERNDVVVRDLHADLRAFNRQHYHSIRGALSPEAAHEFRTAYFEAAYSLVSLRWFASRYGLAVAPAKREKLTEQQRADLDAALARFDEQIERICEAYADYVDDLHRRFTRSEMYSDAARSTESAKQRLAVEQGATAARNTAMTAVQAIVPADFAPPPPEEDPTAADTSRSYLFIDVSQGTGDMFVPQRMEPSFILSIRETLHLDAALVSAISDHYNEAFDRLESGALKAWEDARVMAWSPNPTTSEAVEEYIAKRATALRSVATLEQEMFSRIRDALITPEDDAQFVRLRDSRTRALANRECYGGRWQRQGPGQRKDSVIDVSYLLRRRQPKIAEEPAVDAALAEYERALTPLFVKRYVAMLAYEDAHWRYRAERRAKVQETGDPQVVMVERERELTAASERAVVEANIEIVTLNDQTLEALTALLAPDSMASLLRDYERLCYPLIFHQDVSFAGPFLTIGLHLPGLAPQQRAHVEQLAADYYPAYDDFCRQMIDAVEPLPRNYEQAITEKDPEIKRANRSAREKLVFDRNELNVRTLNSLKAVLNEEQVKALGDLPDLSRFQARDFGWSVP